PAAPLWFSMTTGCPHFCESQFARSLGMASAVPPAGKGTMILTAWSGKPSARAGAPRKLDAAKQSATTKQLLPDTWRIDVLPILRRRLIRAFVMTIVMRGHRAKV